jgi:hypothetical protein
MTRFPYAFTLALLLAGCSKPMPVSGFAASKPAFDPVAFWTGHTHSWGVIENRSGAPTETIQTDCVGTGEPGGLHMVQTLTEGDGTVHHREWHLRSEGGGRFSATANDMDGTAHGQAAGRAFHWQWQWARAPGSATQDVTMSQWMYLMDNGTMMNRTVISKLGVTLAEVTEQFERVK